MGREGNHLFLMRKMPFCGGWKEGGGKEGWSSEHRITMNVHRIHCTETFFPHFVQLLHTVIWIVVRIIIKFLRLKRSNEKTGQLLVDHSVNR
jgi:hypothetical protein